MKNTFYINENSVIPLILKQKFLSVLLLFVKQRMNAKYEKEWKKKEIYTENENDENTHLFCYFITIEALFK